MTEDEQIQRLMLTPPGPPTQTHKARVMGMIRNVCALIALIALAYALIATIAANRANNAIHGSCQFYLDLASVPVTATSTVALFEIIGDSRTAYTAADCNLGPLPELDPRVAIHLKH